MREVELARTPRVVVALLKVSKKRNIQQSNRTIWQQSRCIWWEESSGTLRSNGVGASVVLDGSRVE